VGASDFFNFFRVGEKLFKTPPDRWGVAHWTDPCGWDKAWGMDKGSPTKKPRKDAGREDRLKSALKANLARRKAQTRARAVEKDTSGQDNESKD
jgi:hypothetical protein